MRRLLIPLLLMLSCYGQNNIPAKEVMRQLQDTYDRWKAEDEARKISTPDGRRDAGYLKNKETLAIKYSALLKPVMVQADTVRKRLLATFSPEAREPLEYPDIVPVFESGSTGRIVHLDELAAAIRYLGRLEVERSRKR